MTPSKTAADPVLALLAGDGSDYRGLYYCWEQQQWEAGAIDLAQDASERPGLPSSLRKWVARSVAWRHLRAETATAALVRFIDTAPNEEQQVFLTTQLADEARQLVLLDRIRRDVMGLRAEPTTASHAKSQDGPVHALLSRSLVAAAAALGGPGPDPGPLAGSILLYEIVIVGMFGVVEHRFMVDHLETLDLLPGLREGTSLALRDAHRHVAFGLLFLADHARSDDRRTAQVGAWLTEAFPRVRDALRAAEEAAPARSDPGDLLGSARAALDRWSAAVELELPVFG